MITRNVEQAYYLGGIVNNHSDLELLAPIGMDIVCFRYNPGGKTLEKLNAINKEIKLQLEEQAIALPGYTTLDGAYCIRCAISSHRVTNEDFDVLVENVLKIGKQLLSR
jgi:glutamate/tyrosine decarboxylase-like PLP-dependent enzyme